MRYVILRDDDTNAMTPPECLERLYRPFLDRGLPVNLATIPAVSLEAKRPDGQPEGFLMGKLEHQKYSLTAGHSRPSHPSPLPWGEGESSASFRQSEGRVTLEDGQTGLPLPKGEGWGEGKGRGLNPKASESMGGSALAQDHRSFASLRDSPALVEYLRANPGFHLVQHGYHHDPFEFDRDDHHDILSRVEAGRAELEAAGFPPPETFVAPHDKFSRTSYALLARQFRVISTGWFELRRLPYSWWPKYAFVKARKQPHWRMNGTTLLSHPGCLLSYMRPYGSMLDIIKAHIARQPLTVLVTHWWEYFRDGQPDEPFIAVLHSLADYLRAEKSLEVLSFSQLARGPEIDTQL